MATTIAGERQHIDVLARLALAEGSAASAAAYVAALNEKQRSAFLEIAQSHHLVVRALKQLEPLSPSDALRHWISRCLDSEQKRIDHALACLQRVCRELEAAGCPTVVIKSLDHDPDLGNDLDLFTSADEQHVKAVLAKELGARTEPQSWGDRLAHKWNFTIPDLPEAVEVHCGRLGQTGEHLRLARRLMQNRVPLQVQGFMFMVPAPAERILVAVLQRMYRHFYIRLCDIVNTVRLADSGAIDLSELQRAATEARIWPGTATFLKIVSDYAERYRGSGTGLPDDVIRSASFGAEKLFVLRRFLRIPIVPQGAALYGRQFASTALRGNVPAALRLSLLPPLAATAALAFRLSGDDKGIW